MWRWFSSLDQEPPAFTSFSKSPPVDNSSPLMRTEFIGPDPGQGMAHSPSICELTDGSLAAVWYAGSREGARDVVLYLSLRAPGEGALWSEPKVVVDSASASKELHRFVKKLGNPIIFADSQDRLWLIYVSVSIGGWSGSSLNLKISNDGGRAWTPSQRLTLSPFLNISELVRNNPIPLRNGGFAIPIYHECFGKFPEMLWIQAGPGGKGISWRKTRMAGGRSFIQPSVVPLGSHSALTFYRNCSRERTVGMAVTGDAGVHWSEPHFIQLPNPNSGLNALPLSKGEVLLAFNDSKHNRENLGLAVSRDGGAKWMRIATIEDSKGEKFSYPYMIRSRNGMIHLVYAWRKKRIKHVVINQAWIKAQKERASQ